jgi:Mg-chelatase subunit ChlD
MSKAIRLWFMLAICASLIMAAPVMPGGQARAGTGGAGILLILDCSGSMWGRVEGQAKISIAKKVTQELIKEVPDNVQLGLMAYGHRKKGDCKDIQMIGQLGAAKGDLSAAVKGLSARGKTPIADSLLKAGELLAAREGETTLVLVSDGLETCGGDPCKVAGELKAKGLKVVIHVVGFDVSDKEAAQLKCIASAGGGQYFQANNLAELKAALGKIKTSVVEEKPLPPAPEAAEASASKSKSKRIKIAGPGTVKLKLASWAKMPTTWALVDAESGKQAAAGNTASLRAKAGEYQIKWRQSEHGHTWVLLSEVVKVKSGQTVEAPIDTGIRITVSKSVKPPHAWYLTEPAANKRVMYVRESLAPQVAPAGTFALGWHQKDHGSAPISLGEITLESGKLNDIVVDHGINLQPADWLKEVRYYALINEKNKRLGKWNFFAPQVAPPGKYKLVIRPTEHNNNELLWGEITVPEHGFVDVPINSGAKFLHQEGAKPPYRIIFINLDSKKQYMAMETWAPLPLPPGRYRLDWHESQHGSKRTTLADEVVVEPGVMLEVEM